MSILTFEFPNFRLFFDELCPQVFQNYIFLEIYFFLVGQLLLKLPYLSLANLDQMSLVFDAVLKLLNPGVLFFCLVS